MLSPEEIVDRLRPWLREDYRPAFESALAWGWPRCRTEEERVLYPLLLAALFPHSAVVAPRRMPEGGRVSFQVSVSRATPVGTERHQWSILSGDLSEAAEEGSAWDLTLHLPVDLVREEPWGAAARVVEAIQKHLVEVERRLPVHPKSPDF